VLIVARVAHVEIGPSGRDLIVKTQSDSARK